MTTHRHPFSRVLGLALLGAALAAAPARPAAAQQSTDMPAAVQPGYEILIARSKTTYHRLDDTRPGGVGTVDSTHTETTLAYGLSPKTALMVHVPVMYWEFENNSPNPDADGLGIDDIPVMFQWRFYQEDVGPIETRRAVLLTGVEIPSYDEGFSSESLDPFLGVAYTRIDGRHGLNASALWKFNTSASRDYEIEFGDSQYDALKLDGSYLYRLAPDRYTAETTGSHYVQFQTLGRYETNGDTQLIFAPGYMYEGRDWAFEATLHLPVTQDLDNRPELQWGVSLGVRLLF